MNAPLAATLLCLCSLGCTIAVAQALPPAPSQAVREVVDPDARGAAPLAVAAPAATQHGDRAQAAARPAPPPRDRGLLLAGFALMAGITLRRLGDGSP